MSVREPPYGSGSTRPRIFSWRRVPEALLWIEHAFNRARADARPEEDTRVRIFLIQAVFVAVFGILALGAAYAALLTPQRVTGVAGQPGALVRGDIVDRNGALLATNITHYALYIDSREVWDRRTATAQIRSVLPRVSARRLERAMNEGRRLLVMERLTPAERGRVHELALGGISFEAQDVRVYPLGRSTRHALGNVDTGGQGLSGIERAFNSEIRAAGAAGRPFQTSLDLRVQGALESEIAAQGQATQAKGVVGIVTNVQTGEILAMASWPETSGENLATSALYEMGSVFKTFTVAAALDTGIADPDTMIDASTPLRIGNRTIADFHAQNRVMSLTDVYLHSSNIGTSRLASELGPDRMHDYLRRLGLLNDLPFEIAAYHPIQPSRWDQSTLASLSFGYGVSVTPLHAAAAMQALTNGGRYVPLTLRRGGRPDQVGTQVISSETSRQLLDLMRRNVVMGSGTRADAPGLRVGGKTGSANKSVNGRYSTAHALGTFAAVFPADGPVNATRYQVLILVDEPQSYPRTGGFVAAPAVGRVIERIAPFLGVERADDRWRTALGEPTAEARAARR